MTEWFGPTTAPQTEEEGRSFKVLVVDDDVEVLRSLVATIRRATRLNTQIVSEANPQAGLQQLEANTFDLLISDYRMPGLSGVELLEQAMALQPDCRRILITGYFEEEIAKEAVDRGHVHGYLFKPWSTRDLGEQIRSVLLADEPRELKVRDAMDRLQHAQGAA